MQLLNNSYMMYPNFSSMILNPQMNQMVSLNEQD
jgi:hypothetical protein